MQDYALDARQNIPYNSLMGWFFLIHIVFSGNLPELVADLFTENPLHNLVAGKLRRVLLLNGALFLPFGHF